MAKRYIVLTLAGVAGALLLFYAGDYVALHVRIHRGNAFSSVTVRRFYAVPQKGGKVEFLSADPQQQTCTRSLFPQMGNPPCWYLARHSEQRIDM